MAPVHVETATSLVVVGGEYEHQQTVVVQSIRGARPCRVQYELRKAWRQLQSGAWPCRWLYSLLWMAPAPDDFFEETVNLDLIYNSAHEKARPCSTNGCGIIAFFLWWCPRAMFFRRYFAFFEALWRPKYYPGILFEKTVNLDLIFNFAHEKAWPCSTNGSGIIAFSPRWCPPAMFFSAKLCIFWGSLTSKVLPWQPFWENSKFRFDI